LCPDDGTELLTLSDERNLSGRDIDGRFLVGELVAIGGMGVVYAATQTTVDRQVAIKFLRRQYSSDKTAVARFFKEAKSASKLNHPNTVTIYDFGRTEDELLYIAMELLRGHSLADDLARSVHFTPARALTILIQVCDSLIEAHHVGLVHRDLKPQNIHLETKGSRTDFVKVVDFGLAKAIHGQGSEGVTADGVVCGTPAYMSPEAAQSLSIDQRTDIYSLGVILFEMLTGERPFVARTPVSLLIAHINDPIPRPADMGTEVPQSLETLLTSMLAKDPAERPATVAGLKTELEACLKELETWVPTPKPPPLPNSEAPETKEALPAFVDTAEEQAAALLPFEETEQVSVEILEDPAGPPRKAALNLTAHLDKQAEDAAERSYLGRILLGLVILALLLGIAAAIFPDSVLP